MVFRRPVITCFQHPSSAHKNVRHAIDGSVSGASTRSATRQMTRPDLTPSAWVRMQWGEAGAMLYRIPMGEHDTGFSVSMRRARQDAIEMGDRHNLTPHDDSHDRHDPAACNGRVNGGRGNRSHGGGGSSCSGGAHGNNSPRSDSRGSGKK